MFSYGQSNQASQSGHQGLLGPQELEKKNPKKLLEATKMRDAPVLLGLFLWWWLDIRCSCFLSTT